MKNLMYFQKKEYVEVLEVKEDNYFDCLEFITKTNSSILQETVKYSEKMELFKKYGIYYTNNKGERCVARIGSFLVKKGNSLKVLFDFEFKSGYKELTREEFMEEESQYDWQKKLLIKQ